MAKSVDLNRVVVKVFLYGIQPQIWRRFSIENSATFHELSDAIQAAMGWENKHPHEFRHGKGKRLVDVIGPVGLADQTPGEFQDEAQLTLADHLGKRQLPIRMLYRYDFADEWVHEVVFEKREAGTGDGKAPGSPVMIDGLRNCPEEDSGGTFQYMQALHGEVAWMHPGYDPEAFDPKKVDFVKKQTRKRK
ncbi:MAG TPA: plasmid pRiA4b ORF-3 family protein [Luteolibacter sp.]|nr:plasmid pRiA4b ORF-3 family protein [Luteolibacter sp.]